MKKRYYFSTIFIVIVMITTSVYAMPKEKVINNVHVMWAKQYNSINEMENDVEIVILGYVVDQNVIVRDSGSVYTNNIIKATKFYKGHTSENIVVSQLGGKCNNYYLPAPDEEPLLKKGNEYILFLKQNTNKSTYYIAGTGQGVFDGRIGTNKEDYNQVLYDCNIMFEKNLSTLKSTARTVGTPTSGSKWNKLNLTFDIGTSLSISSTYITAIRNGVLAWNNTIGGLSLTEIDDSDADILIRYDTDANENSFGYTNNTVSGTTINKSYVYIYTQNSQLNSTTRWKTTACHEIGHSLGLLHYDGTLASVMYSYIQNCASTPQYVDVLGLQDLY